MRRERSHRTQSLRDVPGIVWAHARTPSGHRERIKMAQSNVSVNGAVVVGAGYSGQVANITCFVNLNVVYSCTDDLFIGSEARLCTSKNGKEELILLGLPSVKEGL